MHPRVIRKNAAARLCATAFTTAFASESRWSEPVPVALYGVVMALASLALGWVRVAAARHCGADAAAAQAHRGQARISFLIVLVFLVAAAAAWFFPHAAMFIYALIPAVRMSTGAPYRARR